MSTESPMSSRAQGRRKRTPENTMEKATKNSKTEHAQAEVVEEEKQVREQATRKAAQRIQEEAQKVVSQLGGKAANRPESSARSDIITTTATNKRIGRKKGMWKW
jgi:hypothetical protein